MITGKLTVEQRKLFNLIRKANSLIKKALKPLAKPLVAKVRAGCPVDRGNLRKSIGHKETAKGGKSASIIVGPRRAYRRDGIYPGKYATVVNKKTGFISNALTPQDVKTLQANIKTEIEGIIN